MHFYVIFTTYYGVDFGFLSFWDVLGKTVAFIGILIPENLWLDTKIIYLSQLVEKLWALCENYQILAAILDFCQFSLPKIAKFILWWCAWFFYIIKDALNTKWIMNYAQYEYNYKICDFHWRPFYICSGIRGPWVECVNEQGVHSLSI